MKGVEHNKNKTKAFLEGFFRVYKLNCDAKQLDKTFSMNVTINC